MDDVAVELHVLVEINLHVVAVATQIVARQVNQHDVLGILLRVVAQVLSILAICLAVAGALRRARNRVDIRATVLDAAVCLGRRAKDAEASKVEVEEIRAGVNASQGTIELEVIAFVALFETA